MKKLISTIVLFAMIFSLCACLSACGNVKSADKISADYFVGSWTLDAKVLDADGTVEAESDGTWVFNEDGSFDAAFFNNDVFQSGNISNKWSFVNSTLNTTLASYNEEGVAMNGFTATLEINSNDSFTLYEMHTDGGNSYEFIYTRN